MLYSFLLHMGVFFNTSGLSQEKHPVSTKMIRRLVSYSRMSSVDQNEAKLIQDALIKRSQDYRGELSLLNIQEELTSLKNKGSISGNDRDAVIKVFKKEFGVE